MKTRRMRRGGENARRDPTREPHTVDDMIEILNLARWAHLSTRACFLCHGCEAALVLGALGVAWKRARLLTLMVIGFKKCLR